MSVRKPGPCLFPHSERCGRNSTYTTHACRGENCVDGQRQYRRALRGSSAPFDAELVETRPAVAGLKVVDRNAHHPARARWAALIAKLGDAS